MKEISLSWRDIQLIPYDKQYFDFIFECYQDYNSRNLFYGNSSIESREEFWQKLDNKISTVYHKYMIILSLTNNTPLGFIYSYDYNTENQYIYTAIFIAEKFRKTTVGGIAGIIFFNYLFKYFPIRKVYCTVYSYNGMSLKVLNNAGFKIEGILKEHKYFDGKYHDMNIMALYRDDLYSGLERFKIDY